MNNLAASLAENCVDTDDIEISKLNFKTSAGKIVANFDAYDFYTGGPMDTRGIVEHLNYREDGTQY
jgi:hypothetical protein